MSYAVGVGVSEEADPAQAVHLAVARARAGLSGQPPRAAYITATVDHDAARIHRAFRDALGDVLLHGVTSSLGVLSPEGVKNQGNGAVGVMLFGGEPELARVGSSDLPEGRDAGRAAAQQIAAQGGAPSMILFNASPGQEEAILEGVAEVFPGVPCQGGSAADHAIAGQWSVFTDQGPVRSGVSLLALQPPVRTGTALRAPYVPTGLSAIATAADDRRLFELDSEPAGRVLNRWLRGALDHQLHQGGNILAQTALQPIGIRRGEEHVLTIHPAHIHASNGAVDVFARIKPGDELCLLGATPELLVSELARVIDAALAQGGLTVHDIKAASLIFCAGCAGALGPRIEEGLATFRRLLPGVPVLGLCTFGEQGFVPGIGNLHQDLSISLTLFA